MEEEKIDMIENPQNLQETGVPESDEGAAAESVISEKSEEKRKDASESTAVASKEEKEPKKTVERRKNIEPTRVEEMLTLRKAAAFYKKKAARSQLELRIVLVLSLCIIGVLGFLYYREYNREEPVAVRAGERGQMHVKDLEKRALEYNNQHSGSAITTWVTQIQGSEYLAVRIGENEQATVMYFSNETYAGTLKHTIIESMNVLVSTEKGVQEIPVSYDLSADWDTWLPEQVTMNGQDWLVFTEYGTEDAMPNRLFMISGKNCLEANLREELASWFTAIPGEAAGTVKVETKGGIEYCYKADTAKIDEVKAQGSRALQFADGFTCKYTEDGIAFTAFVYLSKHEYLGELTGTLVPTESGIQISGEKYGAYVDFDYEDVGNDQIITPRTEQLGEERMVIAGNNGRRYLLPRYQKIGRHDYNWKNLDKDEQGYWLLTADDGTVRTEIGIDVSKHQGEIDWKQVADSGIKFAYIRVGFRGAKQGTLELDEYAIANIEGALENGIRVGVYFYSQAINEREAVEEAEFVLNIINGYDITEEVVWDTEFYELSAGRGNDTSREERTKAAVAFCKAIENAGYTPMIYANTRWSIMNIDRDALADYPFWFAYYGSSVSYTYEFEVWQYASDGKVPGVNGNCDMDMRFVK